MARKREPADMIDVGRSLRSPMGGGIGLGGGGGFRRPRTAGAGGAIADAANSRFKSANQGPIAPTPLGSEPEPEPKRGIGGSSGGRGGNRLKRPVAPYWAGGIGLQRSGR